MHRVDNPRRVAIALVALGAVYAIVGDLFPWAAAAQVAATDAAGHPLVAYFLTWHATAKGSWHHADPPNADGVYEEQSVRFVSDMTGSAIARYQQMMAGHLSHYDTRYLAFALNENKRTLTVDHESDGACSATQTEVISDPGSYSGTVVPLMAPHPRGSAPSLLTKEPATVNGVRAIPDPFQGLGDLQFSRRWTREVAGYSRHRGCGSGDSRESRVNGFLTNLSYAGTSQLDLLADSKDDSSFSVEAAFTYNNGAIPYEIHWTAHATRMGKCSERKGPIRADDPVIDNEDVHIAAKPSEILPDGNANVKVTVTCDQVAIEDAEVELSIKPKANSGHHDHDNKRPGGKLDGHELTDPEQKFTVKTETDGSKTVKFEPPGKTPESRNVGIAGLYNVKATLTKRFKDRTADKDIFVRFKNLQPLVLGPDTHYEVCGRSKQGCHPPTPGQDPKPGVSAGFGYRGTGTHQEGEWGTEGTLRAFASLGSDLDTFQVQNNERLHSCGQPPWFTRKLSLNDIALPEGGLFDADSTWATPHKTHGRGQGGDVNHFTGDPLVTDCNGNKVNWDDWLMFSMLELGNDYGHWDSEMNGPLQRLHLHVED